MQLIVAEFIKGFGVIHDVDLKDIMVLLHKRFCQIREIIGMYVLRFDAKYIQECEVLLDRCVATFEKLADRAKQIQDLEPSQEEVNKEIAIAI